MRTTSLEHRRRFAEHFRARYGNGQPNWQVHLIGQQFELKPDSPMSDIPLVNYVGYGAQPVPGGNLPGVVLDGDNYLAPLTAAPLEWPAPPVLVNVWGWVLFDATTNQMLCGEVYGQAVPLFAGDAIRILITLSVGDCGG